MVWRETNQQNHMRFSLFPLEVGPSSFPFTDVGQTPTKNGEEQKGLKVGYKFLKFISNFTDRLSK